MFELRPYQAEAKQSILAAWDEGHRKTLLVLPTGCGKTVVFSSVAENQVNKGHRVLIMAHRGELLDQAADKLKEATGLDSALEKAESTSLGSYLPVTVGGHLKPGAVAVSGDKGSQMISGMLLALSQCGGESTVMIKDVTSEPYIKLTTYIASFFGLSGYDCPELADPMEEQGGFRTWYIEPGQKITPVLGLEVERDWSAAAMLLVAGTLAGEITILNADIMSRQSDAVIFNLLRQNNADIVNDSEKHTVTARKSIICPFCYDINDAPDLFAPLFLMACFAGGESLISGIRRLRNKESDRAATFAREFRKLGVRSSVSGDEMTIYGRENRRLKGAECSSHGDHRLAMALTVASLFADGPVTIDDTACIDKSFPGFLELFERLKKK